MARSGKLTQTSPSDITYSLIFHPHGVQVTIHPPSQPIIHILQKRSFLSMQTKSSPPSSDTKHFTPFPIHSKAHEKEQQLCLHTLVILAGMRRCFFFSTIYSAVFRFHPFESSWIIYKCHYNYLERYKFTRALCKFYIYVYVYRYIFIFILFFVAAVSLSPFLTTCKINLM